MGEVYRARDARLGRDVAIKVLPSGFARDADRLHRFTTEARAVAALNHPNIVSVYDIGSHEGAPYIVSELLDGAELRAQLDKGAIEPRRALEYAQQIARGMAAAHEQGIVHRDLKPENLFVTKDDRVKILDFGVAKLRAPAGEGTSAETQTNPGTVLGTVAYMSPEQVRGEKADHRADVFAFGVILHEMLSGARPFRGTTGVEVMNAILNAEPPPVAGTDGPGIDPQLAGIVRRCLEKSRQRRFQSASDLAFQLEALSLRSGTAPSAVAQPVRRGRARYAWPSVCAALALAALWLGVSDLRRSRITPPVTRFQVALPEKAAFIPTVMSDALSVSPNGCCLAFLATADGQRSLWLRRLDAVAAEPLPGTADAISPFWSPDSRFIAFAADRKLKKIAIAGGSPETMCELSIEVSSGSWGSAGVILIGGNGADFRGIYRVAETGGAVTPFLKSDQEAGYWPSFLPDGQHFLHFEQRKGIYIGSLGSTETSLLLASSSHALYAPPGYLLFVREGSLVAQPFDATSRRLSGSPVPIGQRTASFEPTGWAEFSAGGGTLAYFMYTPTLLQWFDRAGRLGATVGSAGMYDQFRLSPDSGRVAVSIRDTNTGLGGLWFMELKRNTVTRVTADDADNGEPVWSPDGRRLALFQGGSRKTTVTIRDLSTGVEEHPLPEGFQEPTDWSLDGEYLAFVNWDRKDPLTGADIWFLPFDGDRKPVPFLRTRFNELRARFSPNRRWVAYVSDESGSQEVYVRAFDGSGEKTRISPAGGTRTSWRHDGTELFYLSADNQLMAVPVKTGTTFEAGAPVPLFRIASPGWSTYGNAFDVTSDGQRFLIQTGISGAPSLPFTVVREWAAELKR
jgi:Tol biopolymer transport system component